MAEGDMHHHAQKAHRPSRWETVPAEIEIGGKQYPGEAVWLEPVQVHVRLEAMLPCGIDCRVVIAGPDQRLALPARVSSIEPRGDAPGGPALVHHCTIDVPPSMRSGFARLLRQVNPRSTPLERIWELTAPKPIPAPDLGDRSADLEPSHSPPARSEGSKVAARSVTEAPARRRERRRRTRRIKGLRTEELVPAIRKPGTLDEAIVRFDSVDLWRRSARVGKDWLQLVLADSLGTPVNERVGLTLVLPSGRACFVTARLARRSRGRIILEAGGLSEDTHLALVRARRSKGSGGSR